VKQGRLSDEGRIYDFWIQYTNVTDGRTDTGRQRRPRSPYA